jgi:hypothetical protein
MAVSANMVDGTVLFILVLFQVAGDQRAKAPSNKDLSATPRM